MLCTSEEFSANFGRHYYPDLPGLFIRDSICLRIVKLYYLFLAMIVRLIIVLLLLTGCSTSTPSIDFSRSAEAQEIYDELVSSGFLKPQITSDYGTGMSTSESAIMRNLGQLADTESETERPVMVA